MRFAKGHGTENDFVILPDPDGELDLTPEFVRRLCDRRAGIGGDGVLRVVEVEVLAAELTEGGPGGFRISGEDAGGLGAAAATALATPAAIAEGADAQWFMDYWNADGSIAEMCGNGARVFARYLLDHGLAQGPEFAIETRGGTRQVRVEPSGEITVDMGAPAVLGAGWASVGGMTCEGLRISVGNPHLACVVESPLADFDLSAPPSLDRELFPDGANLELVRLTGERSAQMLVYERGSGVTRSCGTGAVAAAVAAAEATGDQQGRWHVRVPGGDLTVTLAPDTSLLTGPAVLVAEGDLSPEWLAA
ncbi:MAG TPA: diaminopimelate epimerase [Streptosporangiaceae bacterium]|nr:diaminopimelate epimerase [Streptosporangiaceae bacterium]